jgi:hypothetical protein
VRRSVPIHSFPCSHLTLKAETEAKFESVSVKQVYSFSPRLSAKHTEAHKIAAISQLTTIQHDLHSNKEYIDAWESTGRGAELGTIQSIEKWGDKGKVSNEKGLRSNQDAMLNG